MTPLDHLRSAQAKHVAAVAEGLLAFARRHPAFMLGVGVGAGLAYAASRLLEPPKFAPLAPMDGSEGERLTVGSVT